MAIRLPDLVGSPLSINALREDLQVSHKTVARWLGEQMRYFGLPSVVDTVYFGKRDR